MAPIKELTSSGGSLHRNHVQVWECWASMQKTDVIAGENEGNTDAPADEDYYW